MNIIKTLYFFIFLIGKTLMLSPRLMINKAKAVNAFERELNAFNLDKEAVRSLSRTYKDSLSISSFVKMSRKSTDEAN